MKQLWLPFGAAPGSSLPVPPDVRQRLERVLRLRPGAMLVVADGDGRQLPLPQDLVDEARDHVLRDIRENLFLVALAHDGRRHLALAEARNARRLGVEGRHSGDFTLDGVGGNLERELLLGRGDL